MSDTEAIFAEATTAERTARKWKRLVFIWDTDLDALYMGNDVTLGGVPVRWLPADAVPDVDASDLPGDGVIGGLTISDPPTQAQVQALRDECEKLRDTLAKSIQSTNTILTRLRAQGIIGA